MGDQHGECKVFVGNLPSTVTQDELQRLFGPHGTVTEVVLLPPRARFCLLSLSVSFLLFPSKNISFSAFFFGSNAIWALREESFVKNAPKFFSKKRLKES